jgi:hypothetical protein
MEIKAVADKSCSRRGLQAPLQEVSIYANFCGQPLLSDAATHACAIWDIRVQIVPLLSLRIHLSRDGGPLVS